VDSRVEAGKMLQKRRRVISRVSWESQDQRPADLVLQVDDELPVIGRQAEPIQGERPRGRAGDVRPIGAVARAVARSDEFERLRVRPPPGIARVGLLLHVGVHGAAEVRADRRDRAEHLAVAGDEQTLRREEREAVGERLGRADLHRGRRVVGDIGHARADEDASLRSNSRTARGGGDPGQNKASGLRISVYRLAGGAHMGRGLMGRHIIPLQPPGMPVASENP